MSKLFLIVIFLFITFFIMSNDWENISFSQEFPEGISQETVMKMMSLSQDIYGYGRIGKWPYSFGTYIIIVEEDGTKFHIAVIQKKQNSLSLLALSSFDHYHEYYDDGYRFDCFDFARYAINKNIIAIGIRFSEDGQFAAGGVEHLQVLKLFIIKEKKLHEILSTTMDYTADLAGEWQKDGSRQRQSIEEEAVIDIGSPDAAGYNTIIQNITRREYYYNPSNNEKRDNNKEYSIKYHWSKDGYR